MLRRRPLAMSQLILCLALFPASGCYMEDPESPADVLDSSVLPATGQSLLDPIGCRRHQPLVQERLRGSFACEDTRRPVARGYVHDANPCHVRVEASLSYKGVHARGDYVVYSSDACDEIDKPIIVIEGFDPEGKNGHDKIRAMLGDYLLERLEDRGYDLITVNFSDPFEYLQANSRVVVDMLRHINDTKSGDAPLVVVGFSMGGLIARHALRFMEQKKIPHDTRLYVSVDAPHRGANIPYGIRGTLKNVLKLISRYDDYISGDNNIVKEVAPLERWYQSRAGRQMVISDDKEHQRWLQELSSMGLPGKTRNVAIANGSATGAAQYTREDAAVPLVPGMELLSIHGKIKKKNWLGSVTTTVDIRMNAAARTGGAEVAYMRLKWNLASDSEREHTPAGWSPWESMPGGYLNIKPYLSRFENSLARFLKGFSIDMNFEQFGFIPLGSALDSQVLMENPYPLISLKSGSQEKWRASHVPFDDFITALSRNEKHTYVSERAAQWLWDQIEP
jgi:pimeloyl-ACP methyl ester carboxylesterase